MSEIRQLILKIDDETIAMYRGLNGLAETARHEFIRQRYAAIDKSHERLIELIGSDATPLVSQLMESIGVMVECEQQIKGTSNA